MDETMASDELIRLGLAQADLLIEARCCSLAFSLFPRNKFGFATGRSLLKFWNVFFLMLDAHTYLVFPEQNLVHADTEPQSFLMQAGGDY